MRGEGDGLRGMGNWQLATDNRPETASDISEAASKLILLWPLPVARCPSPFYPPPF